MAFARILRSSALMGGAQVITLGAGFLRAKIIAVVIGPAGVGLVGILTAFNSNVSSFAGWGLGTSGVRIISAASEEDRPSKTASVRKLGGRLAWLGLLAVLLLFWPIGILTFNSAEYQLELFIAGLAVPLLIVTSAWSSLLQASGRIKALARVQVVSALAGLALGLPLIYVYELLGIAASLLLAAAAAALFTWNAARRSCPPSEAVATADDIGQLISLGGALMLAGVIGQLSAYAVRIILIQANGLEAAGYYQAAFAIAASLPGFVFTAMGTDFFPQIAAVKTEAEAQELCEKQIKAGLLLALPLIAGLLTLGQECIHLLYAKNFDPSVGLLSWMVWGVFLRVLSWPMGYWLLARGSSRAVVIVETVASIISVVLPLVLVPKFGNSGAAIGFFLGYVAYAVIMLVVSRRRTGRWLGRSTLGLFIFAAIALGLAQITTEFMPSSAWKLIPATSLALYCAWIYRRTLRKEESPAAK